MITYRSYSESDSITVLLEGKIVGFIQKIPNGYQYFPNGKKSGGEIFETVKEVKNSLEN